MIDHVGLKVTDFAKAKAFYTKILAPLGYVPVKEVTAEMTGGTYAGVGFGPAGKPEFWIGTGGASGPIHVAFLAPNRAAVEAFYAAGIAAGGKDHGPPGVRAHYHPNYFGAFVLDADGNNIEAVCHTTA
ncbi:VOC family protein [Pendulispora rubella]|uniref:VOC family protein n=1 Tax=Pendulispora rubella TaxID=2741070 RepID=A0ABZ2L487_9BACT